MLGYWRKQQQRGVRFVLVTVLTSLLIIMLGAAAIAAPVKSMLAATGSPPEMISYQGFVSVSGTAYDGTGYFKFAIVDAASGDGTTNYWANDATASGEPSAEIALTVSDGLFTVMLGDTALTGMTQALGSGAFSETDTYLRVWFSQTSGGPFQALDPNQRIGSNAYALRAADADTLDGLDSADFAPADVVPSGAVMLFDLAACPIGWSELTDAQGRAIVGLPSAGTLKGTVGVALTDVEDRDHTHSTDPAVIGTSADGSHVHTIDPPNTGTNAVGLTTNGGGGSTFDRPDGGSSGSASPAGHTHTINPHSHAVDIAPFGSGAVPNHTHTVNIPPTESSAANTSDVIPYIQLLVCTKS